MECRFLGTGAAQGFPPVFGRSNFYTQIRESCRQEIRSRTGFRLGNMHQIDISPDITWQLARHELDLYDLEHLMITHTHGDHFAPLEVFDAMIMTAEIPETVSDRPVKLYLSRAAASWLKDSYLPSQKNFLTRRILEKLEDHIDVVALQYYQQYQAGMLRFETVKGFHKALGEDEFSINYLLSNGQRNLLFACDTGFYSDDTWEYLKGKTADIVVMDATFGTMPDRGDVGDTHLNFETFHAQLDKMASIGFIDKDTEIYATHISCANGKSYEELQAVLDGYGWGTVLARDGMVIQY